jgi:hypothetical protein
MNSTFVIKTNTTAPIIKSSDINNLKTRTEMVAVKATSHTLLLHIALQQTSVLLIPICM